jgi:hypothetical protein
MKFAENPYYNPEKCGLVIFESIDTAGSYEFDIFCIWKKLDDSTLWWDTDSGCSCPSPFDNGDHGHDLKPITPDTLYSFEAALKNHRDIQTEDFLKIKKKVKDYLSN